MRETEEADAGGPRTGRQMHSSVARFDSALPTATTTGKAFNGSVIRVLIEKKLKMFDFLAC